MKESANEPERLLASLLSDEQPTTDQTEPATNVAEGEDDVDGLINELEALATEGKRRLLGRKLMIDEERLLYLIDRLRTAVPSEVRQAHQLLDEHDQIIAHAQETARRTLEERGLLQSLETERRRILDDAEREAERIRMEADRYARNVLLELEERLSKLHSSVRNGIDALGGDAAPLVE
jgi:hypothetical protein